MFSRWQKVSWFVHCLSCEEFLSECSCWKNSFMKTMHVIAGGSDLSTWPKSNEDALLLPHCWLASAWQEQQPWSHRIKIEMAKGKVQNILVLQIGLSALQKEWDTARSAEQCKVRKLPSIQQNKVQQASVHQLNSERETIITCGEHKFQLFVVVGFGVDKFCVIFSASQGRQWCWDLRSCWHLKTVKMKEAWENWRKIGHATTEHNRVVSSLHSQTKPQLTRVLINHSSRQTLEECATSQISHAAASCWNNSFSDMQFHQDGSIFLSFWNDWFVVLFYGESGTQSFVSVFGFRACVPRSPSYWQRFYSSFNMPPPVVQSTYILLVRYPE